MLPERARIHPMKSNYEPGMKVTYDPVSKRVVISFRGRITVLPEDCASEPEAIMAGEQHCRKLGWSPEKGAIRRSVRSLW
jgi:hypothetical protein